MASRRRCDGFRQSQVQATRIKFSSSPRKCPLPHPSRPPLLFHARPRQQLGKVGRGGERNLFPSVRLRYDYRRCTLRERDASNVMRHPFHLFPFTVKRSSVYFEGYFYYNWNISDRSEDDFFLCLANLYGNRGKVVSFELESTRTTRERVSMHLATASSSKSAIDGLHPLETVELSLLLTNVNYNVYARVCDEQKQSIFDNSAFTVGAGFPWTRRRRKAERRADFWWHKPDWPTAEITPAFPATRIQPA